MGWFTKGDKKRRREKAKENPIPNRPKHPKPEGEEILMLLESQGWSVTKNRKYFAVRCKCGKHSRWIHLTPSNPNYWKQTVQYCRSCPEWEGE